MLRVLISLELSPCSSQEYNFEEEWPKVDENAQEKYLLDAFRGWVSSTNVWFTCICTWKAEIAQNCAVKNSAKMVGRGIVTLLKSFLLDQQTMIAKKP